MKIAIIKKQIQSSWRSCQSITTNLELAYQAFDQVEVFSIEEGASLDELSSLAEAIVKGGFSHIAWIDHYPHPGQFLSFLKNNFKEQLKARPIIVFVHLFGDFILHSSLWSDCQELFEEQSGLKIQLICASHKQKALVDQFLEKGKCEVIPFPVNPSEFSFDQKLRDEVRAQYSIEEREHLFYYSGRLSYQKNILDIIQAFSHFLKTTDHPARLYLSGPMDDLGIPYLGKEALSGTFYFHWEECLNLLPPEHQKRIQYLGNLTTEELKGLYCASDSYISMSCHNDEDYGMAPAEALMCGLPAILSAWGGFPSFHAYQPEDVHLVDLELSANRQAPELMKVTKAILMAQKSQNREDVSKRANKAISIEAVTNLLKKMGENEITEQTQFNKRFNKLSSLFKTHKHAPFRAPTGGYSLFYREVYSIYAGGFIGGEDD